MKRFRTFLMNNGQNLLQFINHLWARQRIIWHDILQFVSKEAKFYPILFAYSEFTIMFALR